MILAIYGIFFFTAVILEANIVGMNQMFHPPFTWLSFSYFVLSLIAAGFLAGLISTKRKLTEALEGWSNARGFASRFSRPGYYQIEVDELLHDYASEWNGVKARIVELNKLGPKEAAKQGQSLDHEIPRLEREAKYKEDEFYLLYDLANSQVDDHGIELDSRNISYYVVRPERKTA